MTAVNINSGILRRSRTFCTQREAPSDQLGDFDAE
jgi:hypothetical protein